MDKKRQWIFSQGEPGSAIVLAPPGEAQNSTMAQRLLTTVSEKSVSTLVVWFSNQESTWLENWPHDLCYRSPNINIIDIKISHEGGIEKSKRNGNEINLKSIESLENYIIEFYTTNSNKNVQPVLFFDSLSGLADIVGNPTVHDLLSNILPTSEKVEAQSYFHIDRMHRDLSQELNSYVDVLAEMSLDDDSWLLS